MIVVDADHQLVHGQIVIHEGRVVEVTPESSAKPDIVLPDHAIIPGLINAHTHLEFSGQIEPLAADGGFTSWVARVIAARNDRGQVQEADLVEWLRLGFSESIACGVVALADIVTPPWSMRAHDRALADAWLSYLTTIDESGRHPAVSSELSEEQLALWNQHLSNSQSSRILTTACIEQLGLSNERFESLANWRNCLLQQVIDEQSSPSVWRLSNSAALLAQDVSHRLALSPHAPYSTLSEHWLETLAVARSHQMLVAMHVAESPEEREWLDAGTGPMADMRRRFGARIHEGDMHGGERLLQQLALARKSLVIHGNYLNDSEIDIIARNNQHMHVVYCQRTHAHFQHAAYPWQRLQRRGILVALGTDSRSSNPDLNLWLEGRCAIQRTDGMKPTDAFRAMTESAAIVLDRQHDLGRIAIGKLARFNLLPLPTEKSLRFAEKSDELFGHWFEHCNHPTPLCAAIPSFTRPF